VACQRLLGVQVKRILLVTFCVALVAAGRKSVMLDLRRAPIGYEFCADRPPKLDRRGTELMIYLPPAVEFPADAASGASQITFSAGRNDVDAYKTRDKDRLLWATGDITITDQKLTLKVKLPFEKLDKGQYILGIRGDPYFTSLSARPSLSGDTALRVRIKVEPCHSLPGDMFRINAGQHARTTGFGKPGWSERSALIRPLLALQPLRLPRKRRLTYCTLVCAEPAAPTLFRRDDAALDQTL